MPLNVPDLPKKTFLTISGPTNVTNTTFTQLLFDTILVDNVNGFNPSLLGEITVPLWATWIKVSGHVTFPPQNAVGSTSGVCRMHLWRNDAPTPGQTGPGFIGPDVAYHTSKYYPAPNAVGAQDYFGGTAITDWIPVMFPNNAFDIADGVFGEKWSIFLWQNTGQTITIGEKAWLSCEFK